MAFCSKCGAAVEGSGAGFCQKCGASLEALPGAQAKTSGAAIASLIFGIFFLFPFAPIFAIVLGHAARYRIKRSHGTLTGAGAALAGLVLGYFFLFCGLLALPMFLAEQAHGQERATLSSAHRIQTALIDYHSKKADYPESLNVLAPVGGFCGTGDGSDPCVVLEQDLKTVHRGYRLTYRRISTDEFALIVRAVRRDFYNKRSFLLDQNGDTHVTEDDRDPTKGDRTY